MDIWVYPIIQTEMYTYTILHTLNAEAAPKLKPRVPTKIFSLSTTTTSTQ